MNLEEDGGPQSVCKALRSIAPMTLAKGGKCQPARHAAASWRIPDLSVSSFVSRAHLVDLRRENLRAKRGLLSPGDPFDNPSF